MSTRTLSFTRKSKWSLTYTLVLFYSHYLHWQPNIQLQRPGMWQDMLVTLQQSPGMPSNWYSYWRLPVSWRNVPEPQEWVCSQISLSLLLRGQKVHPAWPVNNDWWDHLVSVSSSEVNKLKMEVTGLHVCLSGVNCSKQVSTTQPLTPAGKWKRIRRTTARNFMGRDINSLLNLFINKKQKAYLISKAACTIKAK